MIVIEVDTWSSGMPPNSVRMSSIESMATPTLPTSPAAIGSSESYPIWVGRSKATDSPPVPAADQLVVALVGLRAVPKPAYWRIVQGRPVYIVG